MKQQINKFVLGLRNYALSHNYKTYIQKALIERGKKPLSAIEILDIGFKNTKFSKTEIDKHYTTFKVETN